MKQWVLLKFCNEYDQQGGYFAGIFDTLQQLLDSVDHIGRKEWEYEWYSYELVEKNKVYEFDPETKNLILEDE